MESLRIACVLLSPVLPRKTRACLEALGAQACLDHDVTAATTWGRLPVGDLQKPSPLFPRLDQIAR